jgi:exodeoxyribonuclease V gamma subunit
MSLSIHYIVSLDAIVDEAVEFLSQPEDFFTAYKIVLPTIGARSWLADELAKRLGSTSEDLSDGIVAGVDFSYPGSLSRLIGSCKDEEDPWSVQRLTFIVLDILVETPHYDWLIQQAGGPLLAARRIAERFDRYHFRRPGMILAWENKKPVLAPEAGEVSESGGQMLVSLARSDRWQFDLWQLARAAIHQPSPPARDQNAQGPGPSAVLVAGLEGLAFHQIELLKKLATLNDTNGSHCNVKVLLVHPSSPLRIQWEQTLPLETLGYPPKKQEIDVLQAGDPLVTSWLRGTQEAQMLLASQGLTPTHMVKEENEKEKKPATLLKSLQQTISDGICSTENVHLQDESVRIHRCHDLSRQAEVLHDALLHSFKHHEDLAPHDVLIVSPRISELAPHLEAVFSRKLTGKSHDIELPLVIADRGIREVSAGAELLVALLKLVGSRCSVEDMLAVATHHLVRNHYDIDDNTLEVWTRCIERTRIRWGIDGPRRKRDGLDQPELSAHTWWQGLERMLLGILLPDGTPEVVLGGIVPLTGVDTSDIESLAPLLSIVRVIDAFDRLVTNAHSVRDWCNHIEQALIQLVGDDTDELEVAIDELEQLRRCATETRVPYYDIKTILITTLTAAVGHQPLRTGAITATSMIPLRAVPFRVICVAGFDEDVAESSANDSDDLVERQQLLGDSDPRINVRRSFLDCVLSARNQLIITCTGMSVSTNVSLPLITPLAEFVDFVGRHGVPLQSRNGKEYSDVEVFHPRHACSDKNFQIHGIRPDIVWSHDQKALHVAKVLGATPQPVRPRSTLPPPRTLLELTSLAAFMHDPLWPFVRETLGINPWRNDDVEIPATLPLALSQSEQRELRDNYIHRFLNSDPSKEFEKIWTESVQADGDVPIWGFGEAAIQEITAFTEAVVQQTNEDGLSLMNRQAEMVRVEVNNVQISGTLQVSKDDSTSLIFLAPGAKTTAQFQRPKYLALGQLLLARAAGVPTTRACVYSQHEKWSPNAVDAKGKPRKAVMVREVMLNTSINSQTAKNLLGTLCDLYQQAAVSAYSSFGKAAAEFLNDQNKSKRTFSSFVSHKSFEKSLEVVVYGRGPVFENVFLDHERHKKFFKPYVALTYFKPRTNTYSPE